jgi:hypothetical protein
MVRYLKSDAYTYKRQTYIITTESDKWIRMIGAQTDITENKKLNNEINY